MKRYFALAAALTLNLPSASFAGQALDTLINVESNSQSAAGAGSPWATHQIGSVAMDGAAPAVYADTADGRGGRRGPNREPGSDTSVRDAFDKIMPTAKDDAGWALVKGFGGGLIAPFYLTYVGAKSGEGVVGTAKGAVGGFFMGLMGLFFGPVVGISYAFNTALGNPPAPAS